jgi:hypothetical protein
VLRNRPALLALGAVEVVLTIVRVGIGMGDRCQRVIDGSRLRPHTDETLTLLGAKVIVRVLAPRIVVRRNIRRGTLLRGCVGRALGRVVVELAVLAVSYVGKVFLVVAAPSG